MKRFLAILFPLFLLVMNSWATHNRAGEILYRHISGFTYEVKIVTCTKSSSLADRNFLELNWGDGTPLDTITRDSIIPIDGMDAQRNVYIGQHSYSGPGAYTLAFEDPNRNADVVNVPNSVNQPFCVKSHLIISPNTGHNTSVVFLNPPKTNACYQKRWIHNPGAYDADGDSLSYEMLVCLGGGCDPIAGYQFPDGIMPGANNNYTIDPITGDIIWDASQLIGEYNIAFRVLEWRRPQGSTEPVVVGWVIRDMQLDIVPCDNEPPVLQPLQDTCIEAGQFLTFEVQASDPDGDDITLSQMGSPFFQANSPAQFDVPAPAPNVTGTFNWQTICDHVSAAPYQAIFRAEDDDTPIPLEDLTSVFITVVAPAPENPTATASGTSIELNWDPSICSNANGYKIYRRTGLYGFVPGHCETGVPAYTGYELIGTTSGGNSTSFLDDQGLVFGIEYCYMVVACFPDGAQSYASVEFCSSLRFEFPVITNVSVGETDVSSGIDTIRWMNPTELDTIQQPGPYFYQLYRSSGYGSATDLVFTTPNHPFINHPDTFFVDMGLDTESDPHTYRVELHGASGYIGESSLASSMYLELIPADEQLELVWTANVPWVNSQYDIFRWDGSQFNFLGSSTTESFIDSDLVNGEEYCYFVRSTGSYGISGLLDELINFSQEACGIPEDLTPPCAPILEIDGNCEYSENTLTWNNPNNSCSLDAASYNIWYSPLADGDLELIANVFPATDTSFVHDNFGSIAGCYSITALDSTGNESEMSNVECVDNCPFYSLPNVFTPNNDGTNDLFQPFPYKFVESIDLEIYNRWGQVVFTTTDPDIQWNGLHQDSNEICSDGVYYYLCTVNTIRLSGIEPIVLKGYFHLLKGAKGNVN